MGFATTAARPAEHEVGRRAGGRGQALHRPAAERVPVQVHRTAGQPDAALHDEQQRQHDRQHRVRVLERVQRQVAGRLDAAVAGAVGGVGVRELVQAERDDPAADDHQEHAEVAEPRPGGRLAPAQQPAERRSAPRRPGTSGWAARRRGAGRGRRRTCPRYGPRPLGAPPAHGSLRRRVSRRRAAAERSYGCRTTVRWTGFREEARVRVLGVDPGMTRCGIGVVDGAPGTAADAGARRRPPHAAGRRLGARLRRAGRRDRRRPSRAPARRRRGRAGVQPAQRPHRHGHRAGRRAGHRGRDPRRAAAVALHTPSEVKAAVTGSGRADKAQVGAMVTRLLKLG